MTSMTTKAHIHSIQVTEHGFGCVLTTMALKSAPLQVKRLIIAVCVLAILCIALAIALCVVILTNNVTSQKVQSCPTSKLNKQQVRSHGSKTSGGQSNVFDDLSVEEILAVRDYILGEPSLNVTPIEKASISSNYVYLIELQLPPKHIALEYLDNGGQRPTRRAKVILHNGGRANPNVEEYIVEPAGKPVKHSKLGRSISFHKRVFDGIQQDVIEKLTLKLTEQAYKLLEESFDGYAYHNCTDRCLTWSHSQPGALESGQHKVWIWFVRDVQGMYIQPVGFEVLFDCPGADPAMWKVEMIYYNNMTFSSVERLMDAYDRGKIPKIFLPAPKQDTALFSTYQRRGDPQPSTPTRGPRQFEPDGKRYYVQGRHVEYMGWSFDFRASSTTGIQIFDLKFKGTRIVYEMSLQEAAAFYSGFSPMQMFTDYLDSSWAMGSSVFELVRGVDCPESATFFDLVHYVDTPRPRRMKNAVCVFEYDAGIPLRRHFENDFNGGYKFYGGVPTYALVLRYVSTPYNYDYVYDYLFYANGVVEVRVSTSGYIQATYWTPHEKPYGNEVHLNVAGSVHDHMLNYKVDLDVAGRKNSYQTVEIEKEIIVNPWFPDRNRTQKVVRTRMKNTEQEALYSYNFDHPKYLNFISNKTTKNGIPRGYRIHIRDVMKQIYPESLPLMNSAKWSLHQMVVTKYKENETSSTSIYNQIDPYSPEVDFQKFYQDNESIRNEDLVAWVTVGIMHVPHTEDVPNTATAGNSASFFLRPYNFFEEDPSMASSDAVLIRPSDKKFSGIKVERFGTPQGPSCQPKETPFEFTGAYDFA